jgi:hypothetical protein
MLWDASAINGYASKPAMDGSGQSAIYFSRTSAGSFDGSSSIPAIGFLAARFFCRFLR